uniref:CBS domain-containing protein n=2 Tax=Amphora coffeiformis TaxID=265554 RepID=A0A7S3KZ82_9STRA
MTRWLLLLAFPCLAAAFSVENHRVFVSTPVSKWPKRFVGDCMSEVPLTLKPSMSVRDAMATLYANSITGAPVVNSNYECVGIVSNYDFLWEEAFEGSLVPLEAEDSVEHLKAYAKAARKICAQTVEEVMSDNQLYTITPATTMRHAAELMTKTKLHHLPVVDAATNKLVGILTSSDVMKDLLHIVRNLPPGAEGVAAEKGADLTP